MIERKEIEHLATLSRIKLDDVEVESLRGEIDAILGYIGQIQKVSETAPTNIAIPQAINVLREDVSEREGGEYTEAMVKAAPFKEGNSVKVKNMF